MYRLIGWLTAALFLCGAAGEGAATVDANRLPGILIAKKDKEEKVLKEREKELEAREKALQAKEEELEKKEADLKKREEGLKKKPARSRQQTRQGGGAGPRGSSGSEAGFGPKTPEPATLKQASPAPTPTSPAAAHPTPGKQ